MIYYKRITTSMDQQSLSRYGRSSTAGHHSHDPHSSGNPKASIFPLRWAAVAADVKVIELVPSWAAEMEENSQEKHGQLTNWALKFNMEPENMVSKRIFTFHGADFQVNHIKLQGCRLVEINEMSLDWLMIWNHRLNTVWICVFCWRIPRLVSLSYGTKKLETFKQSWRSWCLTMHGCVWCMKISKDDDKIT